MKNNSNHFESVLQKKYGPQNKILKKKTIITNDAVKLKF